MLPWYKVLGAGLGLEVRAALVQGTGGWPGARGVCCPGTRYWGLAWGSRCMLPWYKVLGAGLGLEVCAALVQGTGGWPGTRYLGLSWYKVLGAGLGLEVCAALVQGTGGWPGARGACCPGTRCPLGAGLGLKAKEVCTISFLNHQMFSNL